MNGVNPDMLASSPSDDDALLNLATEDAEAAESIALYKNEVPKFCVAELDNLYGSILSTVDQFTLDGSLAGASTYVVTKCGEMKTILLFRNENGIVTVLNQMIHLNKDEIERFADIIFMTFDKVSAISFTAIQTDLQDCAYPCLKFHWAEDLVAPLPESEDSLLSALGKNTREIVKRYARKIKRKFPSFRFDVYVGSEIDEGLAQEIYRLHKARMSRKGKGSNVDAPRFEKILRLARLRGLMTVAKIDGEICGGLICWRAGHDYFMRIIAHDPAYDEYKLGTVCCYRTMCECIARGGRFFHFMSGRLLYKYRLLGIEQDFDTLILYRSRSALLKSIWKMSRTIATGANRQTRLWLQNAERKDDFMSRMAVLLVRQWRMLKQLRTALPGS